jgi:hypothetical protein
MLCARQLGVCKDIRNKIARMVLADLSAFDNAAFTYYGVVAEKKNSTAADNSSLAWNQFPIDVATIAFGVLVASFFIKR